MPLATAGDVAGASEALEVVEERALAAGAAAQGSIHGRAALALPLRSGDGAVVGFVSVARRGPAFTPSDREIVEYLAGQAAQSIENVELHHAVERQAVTDQLTGLANRRAFEKRLEQEIERARRFPDQQLALVLFDIDDFKLVNDRLGHVAGDEVLREVGRVLREGRRDTDVAARYGGEELALILPGADLEGAVRAAERARMAIGSRDIAARGQGEEPIHVTVSVGVAGFGAWAHDAVSLVAAADAALYRAKRAGKNRTERALEVPAGIPAE